MITHTFNHFETQQNTQLLCVCVLHFCVSSTSFFCLFRRIPPLRGCCCCYLHCYRRCGKGKEIDVRCKLCELWNQLQPPPPPAPATTTTTPNKKKIGMGEAKNRFSGGSPYAFGCIKTFPKRR